MKLITLNIWGGRVKQPFLNFIKNNQDVDIFCFQELYNNATPHFTQTYGDISSKIYNELQELLPNHQSFFRPVLDDIYGIGIFIKKEINVLEEGEVSIYDAINFSGIDGNHSRNMQWVKCAIRGTVYTVFNVHGLWNGKGKTDTPDRINQSKRIMELVDANTTKKILCGDFNLRPDTESIAIIANGMNNLIKIHEITSTRTSLYTKEEKFADYIFVSSDIKVMNFEVLPDEVSDHSALLLEL